jgi:hypothetical protein
VALVPGREKHGRHALARLDAMRPRTTVRRSERVQPSPTERRGSGAIPYDLVIEIKNEPGALARVAAAISDAGVNLAAATCVGTAAEV